ncbi:MAG: bifunctional phosphoribosylaminoimidazolecarboxamide formyltransferase/IMP cyclohydrolase [Myxococcota bacterium]
MQQVRRALLSVSDKRGLVPFARGLAERGVELISTGGTARALREGGLSVRAVHDVTGFPEMMDGRVKTLHPAIHGGILARRDRDDDLAALGAHGLQTIDLVVVNLYPFEQTVAKEGVSRAEAVEQIDIGGPTLVRAAAKNHAFVGVVTSPDAYDDVLAALAEHDGGLPETLTRRLAADAFLHTARYDAAIAGWMAERVAADEGEDDPMPRVFGRPLVRRASLRYGENPHQAAGLYGDPGEPEGLARSVQLQGKEMGYNNWLDADAAFGLARDLGPEGVVVVKHLNPCGAARSSTSLLEAYEKARACDPTSAFGGIVATAGVVDAELAETLASTFLEVIVARDVADDAREILARKKNLRVLTLDEAGWLRPERDLLVRPVSGATLVQEADLTPDDVRGAKVVTERAPTDEEWAAMSFGWTVCRHVKSNAIVFSRGDRTAAIGAGQMSRVDSSRIAVIKAQDTLEGSAVASDAFFPFPDGVEAAAEAGATAVVQPGGSIRDDRVIEAADRLGLAMVFTGRRHFRH